MTRTFRALAACLSLSVLVQPATAACSGTVSGTGKRMFTGAVPDKSSPRPCEWLVPRLDVGSGCTVLRVEVTGDGHKPPSVDVMRGKDGAAAVARTPSGSDGDWSVVANALNCSALGCGTSRYTVTTTSPVMRRVCGQTITLTVTKG